MIQYHFKICFKCNKKKKIDDFYKHPEMQDGHLNKCKGCCKLDTKKNYRLNIEYYNKYESERSKKPHRKRFAKLYLRRWRKAYPEKYAAHIKLNNAVRSGKIEKSYCKVCGNKKVHGHHENYDDALKVIWLCAKHHKEKHAV